MKVLHVLIVDDEPWNQEIASVILTGEGHRVTTAGDGEEAIARCEEAGYDAILMDIQMPRLDGLATTRRLRASERHRETPIIFLTGSTDRADEALARAAGGDYFMRKPYRRDDLLTVIDRVLQARGVLAPHEGVRRPRSPRSPAEFS